MIPQVLTNLNLYVDGRGFAGRVTEIQLPKLKRKTDGYRAGGMDAEIDIAVGLEKLEGGFTLMGVNPEALAFFGIANGSDFNGTFRGAMTDQKGGVIKVEVTWRGLLSEVDMGSWKPGDKGETKYTASLSYYKLEIDGRAIYEIDPVNCVRIINGTDELAAERAAIGL
ncbi:MAG: phage major tail tube protein [Laribacter sp.]|nr:phage major tail tube protein [Laribacter sp.]MBP9526920.1 phage major tail tube protein [Laribacter sp.]MBP9608445.1 phage major tail tube protein [Laribacter sp.]